MSGSKNNNDLATPVNPSLCNVTQPELTKIRTAAGPTHLLTGTIFIDFRKRKDLKVCIALSCSLRCMGRRFPVQAKHRQLLRAWWTNFSYLQSQEFQTSKIPFCWDIKLGRWVTSDLWTTAFQYVERVLLVVSGASSGDMKILILS
jgi:hypothetical protein